jgi:hypothetical protein
MSQTELRLAVREQLEAPDVDVAAVELLVDILGVAARALATGGDEIVVVVEEADQRRLLK